TDRVLVNNQSRYTPTCGLSPSGPESFFFTDVPPQSDAVELVYELEVDGTSTFNPLLEVTTNCSSATGHPICAAVGARASNEVVVVPAPSGRYFAVVDAEHGDVGNGQFRLTPFLRQLVTGNGECDFLLRRARCVDTGAACFN